MKTFCQTEGHSYVYTSQGKSSRCMECHELKLPWHKESEASVRAGLSMAELLNAL